MNHTHAPEPWTISSEGNLYGDGMYIGNISDDHNDEQTEANRALICAAPALLKSLEQVIPHLEKVAGLSGGDGVLTLAAARAAIAKAKGGAK
jgi:hypothetical protein